MKFRYFIMRGESRKAFLKSEKVEMGQRIRQHKALLLDRDDIESYRPSRGGGVAAMTFKEGRQPEGFIRASKNLPKTEVRPHGKSKEAKPWRDLLESIRVTEDCRLEFMSRPQSECKRCGMPCVVGDGKDARWAQPAAGGGVICRECL